MDKPEKRIDLNSELGMSRRDLIRRGAIVGGTLLWVAPAIQSMAPKAFAQSGEDPGSVLCGACQEDNTFNNQGVLIKQTHTQFEPTTDCCNCLAAHSFSFCDSTGGTGDCHPEGAPDQQGPCPG